MRALLVINPIAGTSRKKGLQELVTRRFRNMGWEVDVKLTQCHGDATRLAREAVDEGYDCVIAAGGDGTVNETAAALCDTGVALGIIPCGSGNGLARHLNIPVDVKEGLKVIRQNHIVDIDYGMIGDHHFFCTCGVGFDAAVSELFASKGTRGLATYLRSVVEQYRGYKPAEYRIVIEGEVITERAFLIAVCNASQYGNNAYIAPKASIDDGLLDITIVHEGSALRTAFVGFDLLNGNLNRNTLITSYRARRMTIERTQPGPLHIDGEPTKIDGPLDISCVHHGLKVFTPRRSPKFMPFITPTQAFLRDCRLRIKHIFG